jgi:hypothetical protein
MIYFLVIPNNFLEMANLLNFLENRKNVDEIFFHGVINGRLSPQNELEYNIIKHRLLGRKKKKRFFSKMVAAVT